MNIRSHLRPVLLASLLAVFAGPAVAQVKSIDLHAYMVGKLNGACRVDQERLAKFEPRMVVVHALIDQTTLPRGWARAKVLQPVLGGTEVGDLLPMSHFKPGIGGARGANLVEGKEYLISMYRHRNWYVVDRALECQT